MSLKTKRKLDSLTISEGNNNKDGIDLFVNAPPDGSDDDDDDSTDSEESEYSGLEDEPDTTDDDSEEGEETENSDPDTDQETDGSEDSDIILRKVNRHEPETQVQSDEEVEENGLRKDRKEKENIQKAKEKTKKGKEKAKKGTKSIEGSSSQKSGNDTEEKNEELNEYAQDSSDEEDIRNTVGNIPMEWYGEYAHIGYNLEGGKIIKPKRADEVDEFLNKMDNPDYWRTVKDKMTGQDVILSKEDAEMIQRMEKGKFPDAAYDPYEPWVDFFTHEKMIHPVTNRPEHKRSFIPSKWEKLKVGQLVHAIKMGWIKPKKPTTEEDEQPKYYDIWGKDDESAINKRFTQHIPAPKMALPGHEESYNPPPEYLLTEEEELAWKETDPEDRRRNFLPKKYSSLRQVPAYPRFINERFERCLDLYLCPRQRKMRMNVNPEDLIPKLPKPKDLQPFPTTQSIIYEGHSGLVRCISIDPKGQWMASGSDDHSVKLWEVSTGRCLNTVHIGGTVKSLAWNPNPALCLVSVCVEKAVILLNPGLGDKVVITATDNMLTSYQSASEEEENSGLPTTWEDCEEEESMHGCRVRITHPKDVSQVTWHGKGDYFATVMPNAESMSVMIHQLSKRRSQAPFSKSKGMVQKVLFHPTRPFLFVATQRYVRVYNLTKQELTKKLMTNCRWVSSMAVHPGGDNVIVGSYDARLSWFDMDLSTKPYQTLRHHKKALRQVCYHSRYPLFASASDDGTVIVCHGMVYNDLLQNPLIVPVKILRGHKISKDLGVLDCQFHPTQPWILTSGADNTIRLFT
ncbi:ribosome biogenesis protein bop1-B [Lingula anatina]|uniref:Ribosome biogenesis protein BOP1 homolog n=1 Tax=Lingula anatina TaxID=7574 RepID=A0A1S3J0T3_LINAN|nr:ribosome biogenesis protein bop1-B [Lingula anatina]|eukprot:XP_013404052.1 ribosome biogenesis protein bop1-B [Lingula anatina]